MTREENPLDGTSVAPESSSNNNNLSAEMELHDTEEIRNHANQILLMTAPSSFGENLQPGQGKSQQEMDDEVEKKRFAYDGDVKEEALTKTQQMLLDEHAKKQSVKLPDVEKPHSSFDLQETEEIRLRSNQILILTSPGADTDEKAGMCKVKDSLEKESLITSKDIRGSRKSALHQEKSPVSDVQADAQDRDSTTVATATTDSNVTNSCTSFTPTPPVNLERDQNIRNLRSPGVIHVQGMHARRAVSTTAAEDPDIEEQLDEPTVADDGTHVISVVAVARDDLEKEVHELIVSKAPVGEIVDVDEVRRKDRRRHVRIAGCIVCILVAVILAVVFTLNDNGPTKEEKERLQVAAELLPLLQNVSMEAFEEVDPARLALSDTDSPQYKAYEWMAANSDLARDVVLNGDDTFATQELLLEQYALATLHYSTTTDESGWNSEEHNFLGVDNTCAWLKNISHCSDEGRVRVLDVAAINMTGTLPDELVFLEELEYFNASLNGIWGSLGPLWSVPLQSLDVKGNEFSRWDIPSNWSDIHDEFRFLDVSTNSLFGTIPTEIFELSNIATMHMTGNDFSGTFPSLIGQLTNLVVLRLGDSSLSGTIPTELSLCTSLRVINLAGTANMTGSIPNGVWALPSLRNLDLSSLAIRMALPGGLMAKAKTLETLILKGGRLEGTIPTEIGLMNLGLLDLRENPVLTGALPSEIGTMSRLRRLDISGNLGITGTIPTEIGNLRNLRGFVFLSTAIGGQIPTEIGRLGNLIDFIARGSQLESSIPTEVGLLTGLRQWDQLLTRRGIGTIPSEFGLLTRLERLALPVGLAGTLPVQLSYLTNLIELIATAGNVNGTIPATFGQLNRLRVLALTQQKLTGSIPLTFGALTNMRQFEIENNTITGSIPQNIREWTSVTKISVQSTNLTGIAGKPLCGAWTQQYEMYGDCDEFEDGCPCCTQCCVSSIAQCSPHYNASSS